MSKFAGSAIIDRPAYEVWRFISDPHSASVWGRGVSDLVITSNGPVGLDSTLRLRMSGSEMEARIIAFEPEKKLTLEFMAGPVRGSKLTYSLEPLGGKTRLTRDLEMRLSGIWRLMQPVLTRREIRDREMGVANIKRILEAETSNTSPRTGTVTDSM
jgi:uncharacterized protein YndB with AHSA1/START domain